MPVVPGTPRQERLDPLAPSREVRIRDRALRPLNPTISRAVRGADPTFSGNRVTSRSTGGLEAAALARTAREIQIGADVAGNIALQEQVLDNTRAGKNLDIELAEFISLQLNGDGSADNQGFRGALGDAALGSRDTTAAAIDDKYQSMLSSIDNKAVSNNFTALGQVRVVNAKSEINKHTREQRSKAETATRNARKVQAINAAAGAYTDTASLDEGGKVAQSLAIVKQDIFWQADAEQWSDARIEAEIMAAETDVISAVVTTALSNQNNVAAEAQLATFGSRVHSSVLGELRKKLATENISEQGHIVSDAAFLKHPDDPVAGAKMIQDLAKGRVRDAALTRYKAQISLARGEDTYRFDLGERERVAKRREVTEGRADVRFEQGQTDRDERIRRAEEQDERTKEQDEIDEASQSAVEISVARVSETIKPGEPGFDTAVRVDIRRTTNGKLETAAVSNFNLRTREEASVRTSRQAKIVAERQQKSADLPEDARALWNDATAAADKQGLVDPTERNFFMKEFISANAKDANVQNSAGKLADDELASLRAAATEKERKTVRARRKLGQDTIDAARADYDVDRETPPAPKQIRQFIKDTLDGEDENEALAIYERQRDAELQEERVAQGVIDQGLRVLELKHKERERRLTETKRVAVVEARQASQNRVSWRDLDPAIKDRLGLAKANPAEYYQDLLKAEIAGTSFRVEPVSGALEEFRLDEGKASLTSDQIDSLKPGFTEREWPRVLAMISSAKKLQSGRIEDAKINSAVQTAIRSTFGNKYYNKKVNSRNLAIRRDAETDMEIFVQNNPDGVTNAMLREEALRLSLKTGRVFLGNEFGTSGRHLFITQADEKFTEKEKKTAIIDADRIPADLESKFKNVLGEKASEDQMERFAGAWAFRDTARMQKIIDEVSSAR